MLKTYLKRIVKRNRAIYRVYCFLGSLLLRIVGKFIKTEDNLILYVVYGGQRYDDSPRFVYEYMKNNKNYDKYNHIWAFIDPDSIEAPVEKKIKIDTLKYYITALKAKYWITNSSASRGLNFMSKNTVNIMFQHGMAGIKKLGDDISSENKSFKGFNEHFDYIIIEGKYEELILKNAWNLKDEIILNIGLPRNDELTDIDENKVIKLRQSLEIPEDKKVILYAPTFREYNLDSELATFLKPPFNFDLWYRELGDKYVLLLTAHYEIAKLMDIPNGHPFVINAFKYPYINDLMMVSDILISDYSSIIFDYSILGRPIISFAYDYKDYKKERGLYDGYEDIFSHGVIQKEEDVIEYIKNIDYEAEGKYTMEEIRDKYLSNYGDATEKAVVAIFGEK